MRVPLVAWVCGNDGVKAICDNNNWTDSVGSLTGGTHTTEGASIAASARRSLAPRPDSQPADGAWIKHCYTSAGTIDTG